MKRTVFVTGSTGFLGTALCARLRREGFAVLGLVRASSAPATTRWLREQGVELVRGDVATGAGLADACARADAVIHAAAVIGYRRRLAGAMQRTNVLGTRQVVAACLAARRRPRLVHVSSIAAVGVSERPELLDETTPWNADLLDAPYFDTKHAAELEVRAALPRGLDAVIVNPAAIYGPAEVPGNSSHVLEQIVRGRVRFAPVGGINVVPLDTVVEGILAALRRGRRGRRYVLGGSNLEYAELVERVGHAAGVTRIPRPLPTWVRDPLRAAMQLVEPFVPDGAWFTPDMCACFGRWLWFDTGRAERELGVPPGDVDASLAAAIARLRRDGRLPPPPVRA